MPATLLILRVHLPHAAVKRLALALLAGLCVGQAAFAQIRIGQTVGITGAVAATNKEATGGARLYFDAVNARGGVNGQRIELISLDDKFDPNLTVSNARELIGRGVVSLFMTRGTPHAQALLPVLAEAKVPLVGPSTGAMVLHEPPHPWVFNVRSSYQREAERAIAHLSLVAVERIAIVQVDDTFGDDAVIGALKGLKAVNRGPVAHEKYDRSKPDFGPIIPRVIAGNPQAVMFIGSGTAVVDGMKALRAAGSSAQMLTLSNNASSGFVKALGPLARGVIVSQVLPYERSIAAPIVKEALDLAKPKGLEVTPAMLEGFASAKVLVEGLRRAGPNPTPPGLKRALETLQRFDLGGLEVSYSPTDHTGLDYADLSIIGADGRFMR